jgi:hypothetical protein
MNWPALQFSLSGIAPGWKSFTHARYISARQERERF